MFLSALPFFSMFEGNSLPPNFIPVMIRQNTFYIPHGNNSFQLQKDNEQMFTFTVCIEKQVTHFNWIVYYTQHIPQQEFIFDILDTIQIFLK